MSEEIVRVERRGDVAIVLIDNPPVSALSHAVRTGIADALRAGDADTSVVAVVLACAGKTFAAGADIKEFGKPPKEPSLRDVIAVLDGMRKPVVAALHGTALGGGLELALGCHARVAAPTTRLGLPEVKLGLLPGGGGTQRLPRAIGAVPALKMILSGEPIGADRALKSGLIDAITESDPVEAAVQHARKLLGEGKLRRLRDEDEKLSASRTHRGDFEAAALELTWRSRRQRAPEACVEAVRAALDLPFDEGLARERELFAGLVAGDELQALRHLFFAERQAAKIPDLRAETKPRPVEHAAVIGAGTMGSGITISLADSGIEVVLVDSGEEALRRGLHTIEDHYRRAVAHGKLTGDEANRRLRGIQSSTNAGAAAGVDLVIEAVFEDMELKRRVLAELAGVAGPEATLATNTSYLDVDGIAEASGRSVSVAGMHFFSPANIMRLVEIVRGRETSPETLATLVSLARRLGKIPVVVGNCHGFVGNRMLRQRSVAAERALLAGALPQEVDAAMVDFGFPMGPFAASDLAGLDIGWRMRKAIGARAEIADALCERGRFGRKTGRGFYRYEPGSREPLPDPEVEDLILKASRRLGIERQAIPGEGIVEQLLLPMINEGARILTEGIAARPGDIDVIWVHGYGFPVWRGGPMFYADQIGLPRVRERLMALAEETGEESLKPALLIEQLASENRGFGSLPNPI